MQNDQQYKIKNLNHIAVLQRIVKALKALANKLVTDTLLLKHLWGKYTTKWQQIYQILHVVPLKVMVRVHPAAKILIWIMLLSGFPSYWN